jgi:hypothetical protein
LVCALLTVLFGFGVRAALAYQTYLPIISNPPTPTLTPTPTPTSMPTPTPNPNPILLPNGDFEQGQVIWNEYSNYGYEIIRNVTNLHIPPHNGEWAAWMGGAFNDIDQIDQTVLVPSDHPYLSFWLWILSTDYCNNDFAYVFVGNDQIDGHNLCYDHNTNGWVQKVYDLRAYSGQTIDLIISVETNGTYVSSIYLDDFEFQTSQTP